MKVKKYLFLSPGFLHHSGYSPSRSRPMTGLFNKLAEENPTNLDDYYSAKFFLSPDDPNRITVILFDHGLRIVRNKE